MERSRDHNDDTAKYLAGQLRTRDASVKEEILGRAQGIFFWVVIIVSLLNKAFDEGRVESIQQQLQGGRAFASALVKCLISKTNDRRRPRQALIADLSTGVALVASIAAPDG